MKMIYQEMFYWGKNDRKMGEWDPGKKSEKEEGDLDLIS